MKAPLDLIPRWFRSRWPLRRYYWQPEEIAQAREEARAIRRLWDMPEEGNYELRPSYDAGKRRGDEWTTT